MIMSNVRSLNIFIIECMKMKREKAHITICIYVYLKEIILKAILLSNYAQNGCTFHFHSIYFGDLFVVILCSCASKECSCFMNITMPNLESNDPMMSQ